MKKHYHFNSNKVKRNLKDNRPATEGHALSVKHRIGCEPGLPSQWGNRGGSWPLRKKVYKLYYVTSRHVLACGTPAIAIANKTATSLRSSREPMLLATECFSHM